MDTLGIQDLPIELYGAILEYLDDMELSGSRRVCREWRNIIETLYVTNLEMDNDNWEIFLKNCSGSRLRVILQNLQYPIYISPEFSQFASRLRVLEFCGRIPSYNLINVLRACPNVVSLGFNKLLLENANNLNPSTGIDVHDNLTTLTKLHLGGNHTGITEFLARVIPPNSLKELYLHPGYKMNIVLKSLFKDFFDPTWGNELFGGNVIFSHLLDRQAGSLQRIHFQEIYGTLPKKSEFYIKLNPDPSSTTGNRILESNLFAITDFDFLLRLISQRTTISSNLIIDNILRLLESQLNMRNFNCVYNSDAHLNQIQTTVTNNFKTLREIQITSGEEVIQSYRTFSCKLLSSCESLEVLTMKAGYFHRKVKLVNLLDLPSTLKTLVIEGFMPCLTSDLFDNNALNRFVKFTSLSVYNFPWYFLDENPVHVLTVNRLQTLIASLPQLRKLSLKVNRELQPMMLNLLELNELGIESSPTPLAENLVEWCRAGGDNNEIFTTLTDLVHTSETIYSVYDIHLRPRNINI